MADRGITFSAAMVRALLDGRKTQTRRLLNPQPKVFPINVDGTPCQVSCLHVEGEPRPRVTTGRVITTQTLPHAKGDRLYVREHWKTTPAYDDLAPRDMGGEEPLLYLADGATFNWRKADGVVAGRHRQAMHMPRWASRLTLLVTEVRVQRLQDVSEEDAAAEGMHVASVYGPGAVDAGKPASWMPFAEWDGPLASNARVAFIHIWDSLHTDPGTRWEDNPWIYAVTFDVRRGNIDQIGGAE